MSDEPEIEKIDSELTFLVFSEDKLTSLRGKLTSLRNSPVATKKQQSDGTVKPSKRN